MKSIVIMSAIIALAVGLCISATPASADPQGSFMIQAQEVKPVNGQFQFPAASFGDGQAKHYVYKHSPDEWIRFFVVKSSDGVIRAAFDACDVCFKSKKGYVQQGNFMICVNCGLKFRTDKVNEVTGGCNPGALKRTEKAGNIIITQQDVLAGLHYFK